MSEAPTLRSILLRTVPVWLGLVALLAVSVLLAYRPLGPWNAALAFGIAGTQALLVAVPFMRLDTANALDRLTAACGLFWLAILFTLTLADVFARLAEG
ncbi:cytochrome C oxidase subunit IV family protein [Methylobacterium sp. Leaf112]|uniref:cytochrome C oxidase subunit IV family protein n=1 Tax=Methylobacterium sp. Leaf112 TaxID=1736258 RepID=UPI0006F5A1D3|nr:cytochrome C oxidase subunit IV family protein [Methylobacterium sp. Leaf112]KQP67308.1 oxidase [Methylobacterium sp. Leaf112]